MTFILYIKLKYNFCYFDIFYVGVVQTTLKFAGLLLSLMCIYTKDQGIQLYVLVYRQRRSVQLYMYSSSRCKATSGCTELWL